MIKRALLVLLMITLISLLPALAASAPKAVPPSSITAVLTWEGNADLDLEIWNGEATEPLGKVYKMEGGSEDSKGPNGKESFTFNQETLPAGSYVVAASFVNGKDSSVPATVTIADGKGSLTAKLNATDHSLWFAFRVDSAKGEVKPIDRFW